MGTNTRNIVLALAALLVVTMLCAFVGAGAYLMGARTSSVQEAEQVVRMEEAPVVIESLPSDIGASETPFPRSDATVAPQETEAPAEAAEPTPTEDAPLPVIELDPPADPARSAEPPDFSEEDLELLWEAWNIVISEFDGDYPSQEELTYAVISGMLSELDDQYTRFAPPDVAERMRESLSGSFEGIGAFVRENEEGLTEIVRPMDGQPAAIAGIRAGDIVVGVNGASVIGQTLDEVIAQIRGPQGTEVTLLMRREGEEDPLEFTVRRELIEIPMIESEMLEEEIAYLRLNSFAMTANDQMRDALQELLAQNPRGLIFDLRDNPGGFLDQSVAVADFFLPEGVVLYQRSAAFNLNEEHRSDSGDPGETIPLVVLVNAGSASASEIVAGAIQDYGRGVLIGETTFGKGSVQQTHTLSDGSELRVTIARWYTPNDMSIDGNGIAPDIEAPSPAELGGEDDTQLQRAIDYLLDGE